MALIKNKKYENGVPVETVVNDLSDVYEWESVTTDPDTGATRFIINEDTYIEIVEPEGYADAAARGSGAIPTITAVFKGTTVYTAGGTSTYLRQSGYLFVVKTSKATMIQYILTDNSYTEIPFNTTTLIISNAVNYKTSENKKVLAYMTTPSVFSNEDQNVSVILADDMAADAISGTRNPGTGSKGKTILIPFYCDTSQWILENVYIMHHMQFKELYRGECYFNNKRCYVNNWLIVSDE
jgi:hypothetical protein